MFHRLHFELYGVGNEDAAPLGSLILSLILMTPLQPVANHPKMKRGGRR